MEYKKKKVIVFANMLYILFRTNLVALLNDERIKKIMAIMNEQSKIQENKKNNEKYLIYISGLLFLISFFFININLFEKYH